MRLYLIRHAIAEDGDDDFARPLSPKGAKRFAQVVKALEAAGVRVDTLLHSPKVRAVETAELARGLVEGETQVTPWLAEAPGPRLLKLLRGERVALVGHEPWLSALLAWLLLGDDARGACFEFKKGGVAELQGDPVPGGMRLNGFWSPGVLRKLRP